MAKMALHGMKLKRGNVVGVQRHNDRTNASYSNPDIDLARSPENYDLRVPPSSYYRAVMEKVEQRHNPTGRSLRKDATVLCEFVFSSSKEFFKALSPEKVKAFFESGDVEMRQFRHLSFNDRLRIETLLREKVKPKQIAETLHVHVSTVYREMRRGQYERMNKDFGYTYTAYSPDIAHQRYKVNLAGKGAQLKIGRDHKLAAYIEKKIVQEKYSPAAVLGEIQAKSLPFNTSICTSTLYSYIDKGVFLQLTNKHLPVKGTRTRLYRHIRKLKQTRSTMGDCIEKRPEEVAGRNTFGHWEMDTVIGKKVAKKSLLVLTERLTRNEIIVPMADRTAGSVIKALDNLERKLGEVFPKLFKSITVDNGAEFSNPAEMERSLLRAGKRTKVYYCHPYSSWERGSNENQNKLIRRHLPKSFDFTEIPDSTVQHIENWMNEYPRKLLGWRSASDIFAEHLSAIL